MDYPYKLANYDPGTNTYTLLTSVPTFAEAYIYNRGTHVIQTHGTAAELEQMATARTSPQSSEGVRMAKRAMIGGALGGALGAAGAALFGGKTQLYPLPQSIITFKPERKPILEQRIYNWLKKKLSGSA
jgi:hypothetical protein